MKRTFRAVGYAVAYLAGLVFVALVTDGLYTESNANANWDECDDCLPFMMDKAWLWAKVAMLVYTGAWFAFAIYRLCRRRGREKATEETTAQAV